jgi:hypothetical protein
MHWHDYLIWFQNIYAPIGEQMFSQNPIKQIISIYIQSGLQQFLEANKNFQRAENHLLKAGPVRKHRMNYFAPAEPWSGQKINFQFFYQP